MNTFDGKKMFKSTLGVELNIVSCHSVPVISRVRSGYEGKTGLVSAQEWNDGLITELQPGDHVFGIADLKIKSINNSTFTAEYIKWIPVISDDPDSIEIMPPEKVIVKDILTLELKKEVWIITSLDRNRS